MFYKCQQGAENAGFCLYFPVDNLIQKVVLNTIEGVGVQTHAEPDPFFL